jgi:multidrug resistance efflux pump
VTAAPVRGYTTDPLYPGARVGKDGRIATIKDDFADPRDLARARADELRAEANVIAQEAVVEGLRGAVKSRSSQAQGYASTFGQDLDTEIEGAKSSLQSLRQRRKLAAAEVERMTRLQAARLTSAAASDTAQAALATLDQEIAKTEADIARATKRKSAAGSGVFLNSDGSDGTVTFQNLTDAQVKLSHAEALLALQRAELSAAREVLDAAHAAHERELELEITVPEGAMVWSLISGPGAPVQPGSPVASWVDCRVMLVDVPISDVETSLLEVGDEAEVVLEGEHQTRIGHVLLTRGSAGTLGSHDLAAIARGRRPGLGQAIVKLAPSEKDVRKCPIGHTAYVDFPGVGIFELMRARLRL